MKKLFVVMLLGILIIASVGAVVESIWSGSNAVSAGMDSLTNSVNADGSGTGDYAVAVDTQWATNAESWTFTMADSVVGMGTIYDVNVSLKHYQSGYSNDVLTIDVFDGTTWTTVQSYGGGTNPPTVDTTDTWNVTTILDTWTKINAAQVRILGGAKVAANDVITWNVDTVELKVNYPANNAPNMSNVTADYVTIKGGGVITFFANTTSNGVNDTDVDSLTLYCDTTSTPTLINSDCTGGTTTDATYPYTMTCTFATAQTDQSNLEYCRIYDGVGYSPVQNFTYTTDSTAPTLIVNSVAGDTTASYFDTADDSVTTINISGEANMLCRWSASDLSYAAMSNACTIGGATASCSVNDVVSQVLATRYISCQDNLTNQHNSSNNLAVQFTLDYTAPTTTDNSVTAVQIPDYTVTLTESDNIDGDPTTLYCTDTLGTCTPSLTIDNLGTVTFTSANRGRNYFRYNSSDDAGNTQAIQNKTININQLPVFTSASDNSTTIQGGDAVNITTVSIDADSQDVTLYVCNSVNVNVSGCIDTQYCTATSANNATCTFASETDSASHTWYAFLYDSLGEMSVVNATGSYTTDSTAPTITLVVPINDSTITQDSVTLTMSVDEALSQGWYSLNGGTTNVTMTNTTLLSYTNTNLSIADGLYYMTFWANDSYGNLGILEGNSFTINTVPADTTPPTITIWSPSNNSYDTDGSVLLNMTTNENLDWAGYSNDSGATINLGNTTPTTWNATVVFAEGTHIITYYANDTSGNDANDSVTVYVDLNNPSVDWLSCPSVNDSQNANCTANFSDAVGLDYAIYSHNATGTWQNSSQVSLGNGTTSNSSYLILSGNHSPGGFDIKVYLFDLSGRENFSISNTTSVGDDTVPTIHNITYIPNQTINLDPGVAVNINVTIVEDFNISTVVLMYQNSSASDWTIVTMDNNSILVDGSSSEIIYNASFTPQTETWYFKINATDFAGNNNISINYTLVVANDTSQNISTTIENTTSITYAQRATNNSLGYLVMNNTGDSSLNFNVTLSSDTIESRLSVNYTDAQNANFSTAGGSLTNITIDINTTDLTSNLYSYNITIVSAIGTFVYPKQLNLQTAAGPYLVATIETYTSSVTKGQTGIPYVSKVTNLGTQSATGVYLNWTLPAEFSITSGSSTRSLGTLPIGGSGTNSIVISVSASSEDKTTSISANATGVGGLSDDSTKTVTIGSPAVITTPGTTTTGGGGGGTSSGGGGALIYDKVVTVVRGESDSFEVWVTNDFGNTTLVDLTLELSGYPEQYFSISPENLGEIDYGENKSFTVTLKAPSYKSYEEHDLVATIRGRKIAFGKTTKSYLEIQNIKLIIQAVAIGSSKFSLSEAEKALKEMRDAGFNVDVAERLFEEAQIKLNSQRNKQAKDLADEIILLKERAFETDSLIKGIMEVLTNPRRSRLLLNSKISGFAIEDYNVYGYFEGHPAVELLDLARVAFERGDYELAKKRADSAKAMILFSIKGNFLLSLFLYWPFMLLSILILAVGGIIGFKKYKKSSVNQKIDRLNRQENNIRSLVKTSQKDYFSGKIGSAKYDNAIAQYQEKVAKIRKVRIGLRNRRIKLLKPREIDRELRAERIQIEKEIKDFQTKYYKIHNISKKEYKSQFDILHERLAEIENEETTLSLSKGRKFDKKKNVEVPKKEKKSLKDRVKEMLEWNK